MLNVAITTTLCMLYNSANPANQLIKHINKMNKTIRFMIWFAGFALLYSIHNVVVIATFNIYLDDEISTSIDLLV
jgi:hypothetical protein